MRLRSTVFMPLMALAAVACSPAATDSAATGTAEDEAAIRAANTAYGTNWTNADTTAMYAMVADDYHEVMTDGTHLYGKAAAAASTAQMFAGRPPGMALTTTTSYVKFIGANVAVSGGTWAATGGPGGPAKGSWTATLRKDGDSWKTVTALGAQDIPMPVMPAATVDSAAPKP